MSTQSRLKADANSAGPTMAEVKTPIWVHVLKWLMIGAAMLLAGYIITKLLPNKAWLAIILVAAVAMGVLIIYASRRAIPAKYLYPGLLLLVGLQIWPSLYTISTAFTNYGDGHIVSKQQSIQTLESNSVQEIQGTPRYKLTIAVPSGASPATGAINFLLVNPTDKSLHIGTTDGLKDLSKDGVTFTTTGRIKTAPGYDALTAKQVNARSKELQQFAVPTDKGGIKSVGLSEAFEGKPTIVYDGAADTLTDTTTKKVYHPVNARWKADDGTELPVGWKENVGFANFKAVATNQTLRDGFVGIFIWNVIFAAVSVISTFLLGMLLALLFNSPRLKGKGIGRALLIMPYAVPGFVTALTWRSMFNPRFGLINNMLGLDLNWYDSPNLMRAAILITNLWLGFPYMFIVCTGALQSIPNDVREAAKIDGANGFNTVTRVIMPLLLVAVGPLLVASFSFNFNNFSLIWLFSSGGPFHANDTSIGYTDLLITYAFRLAFGGSGSRYGLAATISIFIFVIVALMSAIGFARSKAWEEVN